MKDSSRCPLKEFVQQAYIVAHKEDVTELAAALLAEGFAVDVVRGPYTAEQQQYSAQVKCLINHGNVWSQIAERSQPSLVVEADFVPVRGLAELPMPCPSLAPDAAGVFAYLYTCGQVIYGCKNSGHVFGHSASTVAYLADAISVRHLLEFRDKTLKSLTAGSYGAWDTEMGVYLRKECGILNYFPIHNYGEHGSDPNLEHLGRGYKRNWHRADTLAGRLAFYPSYSGRSYRNFFRKRLEGWLWGVGRFVLLRLFDPRFINRDQNQVSRLRLFRIAFNRTFLGTCVGKPEV